MLEIARKKRPRSGDWSGHVAAAAAPSRELWAVRHGLLCTALVALCFRGIHWAAVRDADPFYAQAPPHFDMHTYDVWARAIAAGDWSSARFTQGAPFFYGPVYSYFLAMLFTLFGISYDAVHLVQGALGAAVAALIWLIARETLEDRRTALACGLLAATCAPLIFYEQVLLMEGLLVSLHALLLWLAVRAPRVVRFRPAWIVTAGIVAGLATLARSNFLLLLPFGALLFARPHIPSSPRELLRSRRWLREAALFLCGAAIVLGTSLARNYLVSGRVILTTSNGPMNLYIGNAPDASGILDLPPSFQRLVQHHGSEAAVPWGKELQQALAQEPSAPLRLFVRKLWIFWNSYDVADNVSYYLSRRYSAVVRWNPVTWLLLVPLAAWGAWALRQQWPRQLPLYLYLVGIPVTISLVFVLGRYRLPLLIPVLVWAGAGLTDAHRLIRNRHWSRLGALAAVVAGGAVLLWPSWSPAVGRNVGPDGNGRPLVRVNDYNNLAQGHLEVGRTEPARELLEEAIALYPFAPELLAKLTDIYLRTGFPEKAVPVLRTYVEAKGPAPMALIQLARAYEQSGQKEKAVGALELLLRHHPEHPGALKRLGELRSFRGGE